MCWNYGCYKWVNEQQGWWEEAHPQGVRMTFCSIECLKIHTAMLEKSYAKIQPGTFVPTQEIQQKVNEDKKKGKTWK